MITQTIIITLNLNYENVDYPMSFTISTILNIEYLCKLQEGTFFKLIVPIKIVETGDNCTVRNMNFASGIYYYVANGQVNLVGHVYITMHNT